MSQRRSSFGSRWPAGIKTARNTIRQPMRRHRVSRSAIGRHLSADVFAGNIPSRDEIRADSARQLRNGYGMGGRSAWDETAVLVAVRGTEPYFNVNRGTYRMVGTNGEDEWAPDEENGPHLRVTERMPKSEVARIIDELMMRKPKY